MMKVITKAVYHYSQLIILLFLVLLITNSCSVKPGEAHGFSNFIIDGSTVWFGAGYTLYQIDSQKGAVIFKQSFEDVTITHIAMDGKRLYFGGHHSPDGNETVVWSFDLESKTVLWKQSFPSQLRGKIMTPILVYDDILIVSTRTRLHGLNINSGKPEWVIKGIYFGSSNEATPFIANGQLIYGINSVVRSSPSTIVIADPTSGKTIKTIMMQGEIVGNPSEHNGYLYVKHYQPSFNNPNNQNVLFLSCIDLNTEERLWTYQSYGVPRSSYFGFYRELILDSSADRLYALDVASGSLYWKSSGLGTAIINPYVIDDLGKIAVEAPRQKKIYFLDITTQEPAPIFLDNVYSSPVFIKREALYGTEAGVKLVNLVTGEVIWSIPVESRYEILIDLDTIR